MTNDDFYALANQYQNGPPPAAPGPSAADAWRDAMASVATPPPDMRVAGPGGAEDIPPMLRAPTQAEEFSAYGVDPTINAAPGSPYVSGAAQNARAAERPPEPGRVYEPQGTYEGLLDVLNPFPQPGPALSPEKQKDLYPQSASEATKPEAVPRPVSERASEPASGAGGGGPAVPSKYANATKDYLGSFDTSKEAIERGVQHQEEASLSRAMANSVVRDNLERAERERQDRETLRQDELAAKEAKYGALISEVNDGKIDPSRAANDMNPARKALFIIGAALSGFANRGGRNVALDAIDAEINRDIDAQKEALSGKRAAAAMQSTMLGQMRSRFGDERSAEAATRAAMYEKYKIDIDDLAAQRASQEKRDEADLLKAGIDQKKAAAEMQLFRPTPTGPAPKMSKDESETYVPAAGGFAKDKETATKLNAMAEGTANLDALVNEARAIRKEQGLLGRSASKVGGLVGYTTDARARLEEIDGQMTLGIKDAKDLKQISESDAVLIQKLKPVLTNVGPSTDVQLDAFQNHTQQQLQRAFRTHGIKQAETGYVRDAQGNLVPANRYTGTNLAPRAPVKTTPSSAK